MIFRRFANCSPVSDFLPLCWISIFEPLSWIFEHECDKFQLNLTTVFCIGGDKIMKRRVNDMHTILNRCVQNLHTLSWGWAACYSILGNIHQFFYKTHTQNFIWCTCIPSFCGLGYVKFLKARCPMGNSIVLESFMPAFYKQYPDFTGLYFPH